MGLVIAIVLVVIATMRRAASSMLTCQPMASERNCA